jgi:NAD+ synthase (glutamine-hydrolysing)
MGPQPSMRAPLLPAKRKGMLPLRTALAQVDLTVGAIEENARQVREQTLRAKAAGAQLVVFPELTLSGYPPRDLLLYPGFVLRCERALADLAVPAEWSHGIAVVLGSPLPYAGPGQGLHNAAVVLQDGQMDVAHKVLLPTYDVFDEGRYFDPGAGPLRVDIAGQRVGVVICEDVWNDKAYWQHQRYPRDPVEELAHAGLDLLVTLNASPYAVGKPRRREDMLVALARRHRLPIAYVNLVGGNDALLFDGHSTLVEADGVVRARAPAFAPALLLDDGRPVTPLAAAGSAEEAEQMLDGLALGVRDYLAKTGFKGALVGLSGGIDSALTVAIAVRALGPAAVRGIALPTRYNADISELDARALAEQLGIRYEVLPIERLRTLFLDELAPHLHGGNRTIAEENLQSRLRGTALMALSNESGELLLNTGNKSELAMGYCTLYGDMNGALAVIGDLSKTEVYRLARQVNHARAIIPPRTFERPPSAELRENQRDQDSLPPYDVLDEVLRLAVEEHQTLEAIVARGFAPALVRDVLHKLVRSEYKRRQAAPILRVSEQAFGEGWRFPIAQGFRES